MAAADILPGVARKVLASAVVLLIIGVSVYAVVVVLRPAELTVSVVGGSLQLQQQSSTLFFKIQLGNLGGRGTIFFTGVTARLVERNNLTIANLTLSDMIVEQQSTLISSKLAVLNNKTTTSHGKMFFSSSGAAAEVAVIIHANLTTNLYALRNRTSTPTTYTCYNVTVDVVADPAGKDDVPCHLQLLKSPPRRG